MKRKLSVFIVLLLLAPLLCLPAQATDAYVVDGAGFLSDSEAASLEDAAAAVSQNYNCGVYVLTVPEMEDLGYGSDPYVAAYSYYHANSLGMGSDRDGIIVFISAEYLDYAVFVYGDGAEYAFDPYGLEQLEGEYISYLSGHQWYKGFDAYIKGCARYLALAAEGEPVREGMGGSIGLGLIIGLVIAFLICKSYKNQLKSVREEQQAMQYNVGGINLSRQLDQYTHRTVTKRKIKTESGSGSTSTTSRSGGGGHGRSGRL